MTQGTFSWRGGGSCSYFQNGRSACITGSRRATACSLYPPLPPTHLCDPGCGRRRAAFGVRGAEPLLTAPPPFSSGVRAGETLTRMFPNTICPHQAAAAAANASASL